MRRGRIFVPQLPSSAHRADAAFLRALPCASAVELVAMLDGARRWQLVAIARAARAHWHASEILADRLAWLDVFERALWLAGRFDD